MSEHAGRRIPRLVWAAWAFAAAVLAILAVAVTHHLNSPAEDGMSGMSMSNALYRANESAPTGSLMSRKLLTAWQLDSVAVAILLILATVYLTAVITVRKRGEHWPPAATAAFLAGLIVCGLATNSSIAVYDMSLFTAHMIGHLMLVMLAPALLVAGRPLNLLVQVSQGQRQERIRRALKGRVVSLLTAPPVALASYVVVIVATHLTGLMNTIMRETWAGQLEHLAYVLLGCQFFVVVIGDAPIRWRLSAPARFFMLAISMAVDTFTGLVLLQSSTPIYMVPPIGAHINPVTDTQTGGAIMWFGGDGIMAVIMVIIAIGWVRRPDTKQIEAGGWLEQARRSNFATTTGSAQPTSPTDGEDFDDNERRLSEYNEWLQRLESKR